MRKVLMITTNFPFGSPMALRLRAISKLFIECNWEIVVYTDKIILENNSTVFDFYNFKGIKIYGIGENLTGIQKIFLPIKFKKKINNIIDLEQPDLVFSNSLHDRFFIVKDAVKHRCPLILECVEWYDPSTFKFGRLSHHYILHTLCWHLGYPNVDGALVISKLLEQHYKKTVKNVLRIPTIVDSMDDKPLISRLESDTNIKLLFAGSLAKTKDSIKPFVEALDLINDTKVKFIFNICGVQEEEIIKHIGKKLYKKYKKQIVIYGKIPQNKISEMYENCDYGIFFRPDQRSSQAGFSTKLGEGMSKSVPFIINNTGDISLYIRNEINGFIVNDTMEIAEVYRKILNASSAEKSKMRVHAWQTANQFFFYRTYLKEFNDFLNKVMEDFYGKI